MTQPQTSQSPLSGRTWMKETFSTMERILSIESQPVVCSTGLPALDSFTRGLPSPGLTLLAARPYMGATSFALQLAVHQAQELGRAVLFVSLDLPVSTLGIRLVFTQSRLDYHQWRQGEFSDEDFAALAQVAGRVSESSFFVDDASDPKAIAARARELHDSVDGGLALVIVDGYEHLKSADGKFSAREQRMEAAHTLSSLAEELNTAVLLTASLDEHPARGRRHGDYAPERVDLDPLGAIVDRAKLVLALHREDFYDDHPAARRRLQVGVLRSPTQKSGAVFLGVDPRGPRFFDYSVERSEDEPKEAPAPDAALVACDYGDLSTRIVDLARKRYPDGFSIDDLLGSLSLLDREALYDELTPDLKAAFLGQVFFFRGPDRLWCWCDLAEDDVFGQASGRAISALFSGQTKAGPIDLSGLADLIHVNPHTLISWGDGLLSNGHWLLRVPGEVPDGILSVSFHLEHLGRQRPRIEAPLHLFEPDGHEPCTLSLDDEGHPLRLAKGKRYGHSRRILEPVGVQVSAPYLDGLLSVLGVSPGYLGDVRLLAKSPAKPVLLQKAGTVLAALSPLNQEADTP